MKVDLHTHAKERSGCSASSEEELIQAAIDYGLDGLAFTDHGRLVPEKRLAELNEKFAPFRVFGGIEVSVEEGEDVLVFGVQDRVLERVKWKYADLHKFVRQCEGCLVLAHPLRYRGHVNIDLENAKPDAIELHSINIGVCDEPQILAIARQAGCHTICNSDAHWEDHVGLYHVDILGRPENDAGLVSLIRYGAFEWRCDTERVAIFNGNVHKRENLIRQMISEGRDRLYYREKTGEWEGYFDRVAMGKSYII
jgi:hypothetical protein